MSGVVVALASLACCAVGASSLAGCGGGGGASGPTMDPGAAPIQQTPSGEKPLDGEGQGWSAPLARGLVTIATGQTPFQLVADDTYVYWTESGGTDVLDCPVSGCPSTVATVLSSAGWGAYSTQAIAVAGTTAYFLGTSFTGIDTCAGAGCGAAPALYRGVPTGTGTTWSYDGS